MRRNRARLAAYTIKAEKGCKYCGERDPVCLCFHHRDPKKKSFTIGASSGSYVRTEKDIRREAKKCDVVCFNCHMKLHVQAPKQLTFAKGVIRLI